MFPGHFLHTKDQKNITTNNKITQNIFKTDFKILQVLKAWA